MKNRGLITTLLLTQGISLIGSRMTGIAIGIWLFQATEKTTYLLLIPFFNEIPSLLTGHIIGVFVDRWHKKYSIILGDFGQAVGTLILLLSLKTIGFSPWILYSVVALQGMFSMMQTTAADVMMTLLTDEASRDRINGLKEMIFPVASFLGPALTAVIYPFVGLTGVITLDLVSFLIAVITISTLRLPAVSNKPQIEETRIMNKALSEALHYFKKHKSLVCFLIYFGFTNFMLNGSLELITPYLLSLSLSESAVAGMMSFMGIATFTGAFLITIAGSSNKRVKSIFMLMLLSSSMMILLGISRQLLLIGLSLFLVMLPLPMVNARLKSLLQSYVPVHLQGRVFSISYQIAYGTAPISFILVGPIVDKWLEPNMIAGTWPFLSSWFGNSNGSGIGVVLAFAGISIFIVTFVAALYEPLNSLDEVRS